MEFFGGCLGSVHLFIFEFSLSFRPVHFRIRNVCRSGPKRWRKCFFCVNCVDFFPFYFFAFLNSEITEMSPLDILNSLWGGKALTFHSNELHIWLLIPVYGRCTVALQATAIILSSSWPVLWIRIRWISIKLTVWIRIRVGIRIK
jgi:hypothetical protein